MQKKLLLISLFFWSLNLSGQNDSIKSEILNYSDTKSEIISKGRRMLLDHFTEGRLDKVKELKDYLKHDVENADYAAFYPVEYWLILCWTQEYSELLESVNRFDSLEIARFQRKIKPQYDLLFEKIRGESRESEPELQTSIAASELEPHEKDFLSLYFKYLITDENYAPVTQDTLNALSDNFLKHYPESEYTGFIRENIRYKFVPSKWGFGFEFFSGYGILTGNLKDSYRNVIPFGVAFDIAYKKATLYLRDYIGFSKTQNDIRYSNGVWENGSQVRIFLPEASLGYLAFSNNFLKASPFAGISATDIGPTEYDVDENPDLEDAELEFTTTYTLGINFDIKLGRSKTPLVSHKPEEGYWFLRIRYAYNIPRFERKYDGVNGNLHSLTIGIGGFARKIKREY